MTVDLMHTSYNLYYVNLVCSQGGGGWLVTVGQVEGQDHRSLWVSRGGGIPPRGIWGRSGRRITSSRRVRVIFLEMGG